MLRDEGSDKRSAANADIEDARIERCCDVRSIGGHHKHAGTERHADCRLSSTPEQKQRHEREPRRAERHQEKERHRENHQRHRERSRRIAVNRLRAQHCADNAGQTKKKQNIYDVRTRHPRGVLENRADERIGGELPEHRDHRDAVELQQCRTLENDGQALKRAGTPARTRRQDIPKEHKH